MGCLLKIFKDIELLKARNDELRFSYPYILLVCSCIDLFGGIEKGFTSPNGRLNSKERFDHIQNVMELMKGHIAEVIITLLFDMYHDYSFIL